MAEVKVKVMLVIHGGCRNIVPLVLVKENRPEVSFGEMGLCGK